MSRTLQHARLLTSARRSGERGSSVAEYLTIVAAVAALTIAVATPFGVQLAHNFNAVTEAI